jgi:hypothetical protein
MTIFKRKSDHHQAHRDENAAQQQQQQQRQNARQSRKMSNSGSLNDLAGYGYVASLFT